MNRQSEGFAREGIDLDVLDLGRLGRCRGAAALSPLVELIRRHVLKAQRIHGDDTTVPVLAKGKTITGRLWTYVRDDRPFGRTDPPAAVYAYSRNREGEHPRRHLADHGGILQADAFAGFYALDEPSRKPGPITETACWSHARRKFFVLADVAKAPLALERCAASSAVRRRARAERPARSRRLALRKEHAAPLVGELEAWMRRERARLSRHNDVAKAMEYMLKRWPAFTRFLDDGKICLTNNAAERALRGIALGRRSWLFAGSDRGGERAAAIYTLITTAKLNDVDPQAWLEECCPHRRSPGQPPCRPAALELATRRHRRRSLNISNPRPSPDGYFHSMVDTASTPTPTPAAPLPTTAPGFTPSADVVAQAMSLQKAALADTKLPHSERMALVNQALALRTGTATLSPAATATPAQAPVQATPTVATPEPGSVEALAAEWGSTPAEISTAKTLSISGSGRTEGSLLLASPICRTSVAKPSTG